METINMLTSEEINNINARVAELCGWTALQLLDNKMQGSYFYGNERWIIKPIPDYFGDLNACYQMTATIKGDDRQRYYAIIDELNNQAIKDAGQEEAHKEFFLTNAGPKLRVMAFLLLRGVDIEKL